MAAASGKVAWVTGAAGFIGQHVTSHLTGDGWTVVGIDRTAPQKPRPDQIVGEIAPDVLESAMRIAGAPQLVFHGAGTGSVGESLRDPSGSRRDTVGTTEALLAFLLQHAPQARFTFPSSAAVYGDTDETAIPEERAPKPLSPYGEFKLAAEQACLDAARRGLKVAVIRLFSVYGPGLRKQLPWDLGQRLLSGAESVTLFGTGDETRDFIHVADVARLIGYLGATQFVSPLVVNGGCGVATSVRSFAAMFAATLGVKTEIAFNGQTRAGDPKHFRAETRRLAALGFKPEVMLREGLAAYAAWLKSVR